jgi:hypothetical protein
MSAPRQFRSAATITAEPWVSKPVPRTNFKEKCFDGRWHITQTDRLPGTPTQIWLTPGHVAGGRRPAVGAKGTLIETVLGPRESEFRWEPLSDEPLPNFCWPHWKTRYRDRGESDASDRWPTRAFSTTRN